jgi:tetratricopeptide (TPR) repeat protein
LEKKLDQQTGTESKSRLIVSHIEQINIRLHAGDYSSALDLLRGAAAEFPNHAELSELEKLAQAGVKRSAEASRLITESQELFAQRKSAEAIQLLREAHALDKNNALARAILANALVEHAHSLVETDWREAETLAKQALDLNPSHPTAKTIRNLILDRKKASPVEEWVSQARKLQSSGDLFAALSRVEEGLDIYPNDPKLLQTQDAIQRDQNLRRRQARRRDLEDLRRMELEIDAAADDAAKKTIADRIQRVAANYWTDGEIIAVANGLMQRLGLVSPSSSAASPPGAVIFHVPPRSAPKPAPDSIQVVPGQFAPGQVPPSPLPPSPVAPGNLPPSTVPQSNVPQSSTPPTIAPQSAVPQSIAPPSIAPPRKILPTPPEPQLAPTPAAVVAAAKPPVMAATVKSPSSQPKQPTRSNTTTLILVSAAAIILVAATFFFTRKHYGPDGAKTSSAAPTGSAPAVSAPTGAAPAETIPAPSLPASGAASDSAAGKVAPDDRPVDAQPVGAQPVDAHPVNAQPPAESGHNLGTLLVVAGQDDAKVFLNGKLQRQLTHAGQLRLPNLELKDYVVQVSKSGFQDPPQQKIRIRNGEQARLIFNLQPQPRVASLTILGGAPGTTVLVDQTLVGTIQPDGTLSVSTVNPGDHTVELRKERFKPRQFKKHFVAGATISLAAADAALEAAPGELKISFSPPDATVALVKGDLLKIVSNGVPLNLSAGTYTLTARTAERFTRSSTFEVLAGQSKTLDLSLAPSGMSKWDDPGAWKHEGDSFIRKGGDFVLYGVVPAAGTFVFSAMPAKGHLLQWVLNYSDPKNYVLLRMDDNNFYRTVIRNGEKRDEIIVPDKGDKKSFRTFQIRVSPAEIVHQIKQGNSWTVLDRWTQPGTNLSLGKFGFYIPGNDQVALSSFAHYADLNIR